LGKNLRLTFMAILRYAAVFDTNLGGGLNDCPAGTMTASSVPYSYSLLGSGAVAGTVPGQAGAILTF
jgi:pectate lyase